MAWVDQKIFRKTPPRCWRDSDLVS